MNPPAEVTAPPTRSAGRNSALDVFRGLAAVAIALHHLIAGPAVVQIATPLAYLVRILSLGWVAVDAFFVLSGFLITSILLRQRGEPGYYTGFYVRRACRVVPLYFLLLVAYQIFSDRAPGLFQLVGKSPDPIPVWSYFAFLQNFFMAHYQDLSNRNLGLTWSLAVEEQFYLGIPLLLAICRPRLLPYVLAGGIILSLVLQQVILGIAAYVLLPTRMAALLAGSLLAVAAASPAAMSWMQRHRIQLAWSASILGGAGACWLLGTRQNLNAFTTPVAGVITAWAWLTSVLILSAIITTRPDSAARSHSPVFAGLAWLGLRAYGIYLLHPWAQGIAYGLAGYEHPLLTETRGWAPLLAAVLLTVVLAEASYRWLEVPAMRYGHGVLKRSRSRRVGIA